MQENLHPQHLPKSKHSKQVKDCIKMEKQTKVGRLVDDAKEYVDLRIDSFKLQMVESLSTLFSKGIGFVLMILLVALGLIMFTVALTLLLAQLIGSVIWALVIMGTLLCLVAVLIYLRRDAMFGNSMVAMFSNMFFPTDQNSDANATK